LKHSSRPALLILTSSFPSSPSDESCGYVRDFARSVSEDFDVEVLAPPDLRAIEWPADRFKLTRSRSALPFGLDPFQAGHDLNDLASGAFLSKLRALPSLLCFFARAFAKALRADAVCSHWLIPSGLAGALASRFLRKPHIVVEHSGALHFLERSRAGKTIARFITTNSDRVVVVSADLKRKLVEMCPCAPGKIEVIPMGITAMTAIKFAAAAKSCAHGVVPGSVHSSTSIVRTLLFIGRLTEIKGLDVLLTAMKGLDNLHLIVAGDGEKRGELETLARDLSVSAAFVGRVGAVERNALLSRCDAAVIPSRVVAGGRTEGMPVVCLEALAAGCVVVASRTGGLGDVIVDGENGLLVEPGDHRMLREKLLLALGDNSLRRILSENARRTAATYDWSRIGPRFSELTTSVLKNDQFCNKGIEAGNFCG
jgi:colanic acid/amylovoran biosynthesis glycosyltransferase